MTERREITLDIVAIDGLATLDFVKKYTQTPLSFVPKYDIIYADETKGRVRNSSAEVDCVIQMGGDIIPVEVKGGATGSLKSLNFFLNEKKRDFAVRFNMGTPSLLPNTEVADSLGRKCRYSLLSLPMYMVCQLKRLAREAMEATK